MAQCKIILFEDQSSSVRIRRFKYKNINLGIICGSDTRALVGFSMHHKGASLVAFIFEMTVQIKFPNPVIAFRVYFTPF